MSIYKIQSGDTLSKIAKAHNTTVEELQRINNIKNPNLIFAGSQLKLSEDAPQETVTIPTQEQVAENHAKLDSLNRQVSGMREELQSQEQSSGSEFNFTRIGEVAVGIAAWEGGKWLAKEGPNTYKKVAPKVAKATKQAGKTIVNGTKKAAAKTADATKQAGKAIASETKKVATKTTGAAKQAGKAIANGTKKVATKTTGATKQAGKAIAKATQKANATSSTILKTGKAGKLLGRAAMPVAVAVSAIEIHDAYKEGGTKKAVKQTVKTGTGLACAAAGAKIGAIAGALTGPAAPVAVPVLTVVGSVAGYFGGEKLVDSVTKMFE